MPKVGVCLSGCGVFDGAEITEAVCTILALDQKGAEIIFMAPDIELDEIDHITQKPTGAKRNVLKESARIARGEIKDVKDVKFTDIDALIFPGGFGAAKNLSNFAEKGPEAVMNPDVARLAREVHEAGKPIGAICIAPALIAILFKGRLNQVKITIGNDKGTAQALEAMGAKHEDRNVNEVCIDEDNKIVTTPAYMLAQRPSEVWEGISKLVDEVLKMIGK